MEYFCSTAGAVIVGLANGAGRKMGAFGAGKNSNKNPIISCKKIVEKKSNKRLHFTTKCDRLLCGIPNIVSRGGGKPPSGKFQGG